MRGFKTSVVLVFIITLLPKSFGTSNNYQLEIRGFPWCRTADTKREEKVTVTVYVHYMPFTYGSATTICGKYLLVTAIFASATIETNVIYVRYTYSNSSTLFTREIPRQCVNHNDNPDKRWNLGDARFYCHVRDLVPP
uniref:Secreted protein n=1 Tax=Strongyloides papillosus TaxID=174720 RepID=A0A0N5C925_STREA